MPFFWHTNLFHLQICTGEAFHPTEPSTSCTARAEACRAPLLPEDSDAWPQEVRPGEPKFTACLAIELATLHGAIQGV